MNKRKTIITIAIYLVCLVAVIFGFLFFLRWDNQRRLTKVYVAVNDVAKGTAMTEQLMNSNFKYIEVPNNLVEGIEQGGTVVVDDTGLIANKKASVEIKKGTTLTTSMFIDSDAHLNLEDGFKNPQKIWIDVPQGGEPVDKFRKEQDITIFGKLTVNVNGHTQSLYTTISNKMRVKDIEKKEDETVSRVAVVVEKDEVTRIKQALDSAEKYYFLNGALEQLPPQLEDEVKNEIFNNTGYLDNRDFRLNRELRDTTSLIETITNIKTFSSNEKYKDLETFVIAKESNRSINFTWEGYFNEVKVKHINFDGTYGQANKTYTQIANDINYVSDRSYRTFTVGFNLEGYYELEFKGKEQVKTSTDKGTVITMQDRTYKYRFVIEQQEVEYKTTGNIRIKFDKKNEAEKWVLGEAFENTTGLYKPYYLKIDELKDYRETINFNNHTLDFLKKGSTTYDIKQGIGTLGYKKINDIYLNFGDKKANVFYSYLEQGLFDDKADILIEKYFTTSEPVEFKNENGEMQDPINGIELLDRGEFETLKGKFSKKELMNIIKQLDHISLSKQNENEDAYLRALTKHFLIGKGNLELNKLEKETLERQLEKEITLSVTTAKQTYTFNVEIMLGE